MPERYAQAILKYLAANRARPLKPSQLARQLGVSQDDYGTFRQAVKQLRDSGRVVLGAKNALMLPEMTDRVVGFYRANPKGFGFVIPEQPNAHGDLYVPRGADGGAMTGDLVLAEVRKAGRRAGQAVFRGRVVEILARARNRFVGQLKRTAGTWFVVPDGVALTTPIVVRDISATAAKEEMKVVVEIVEYPKAAGQLPAGVIVETLGPAGPLEVETRAVIHAHGLVEDFSQRTLSQARDIVDKFDPGDSTGREDLTDLVVVTVDPPDARDFDDAISIETHGDGTVTLGVHIADVSHFVRPGGALDEEARRRATSVYFPRKVLPMLPEVLSNGVCSLQEGQARFCKSVFIEYSAEARPISARFAETVIRSTKRLTYVEAQKIIDGQARGYDRRIVETLRAMDALARRIEQRRRAAGMIELDLPQVELIFDENDRPIDAAPADSSYTHKIIEMFMIEANEAVARLLDRLDVPFLRRVHPPPDRGDADQLRSFVRACGHKLPKDLSRKDMQALLESVKGRAESYAVNLALLRTFQRAEYSPMRIGHYALASENYCHFTSPIRRYPDLTVHRLIGDYCRGKLKTRREYDLPELVELGRSCSAAERRAEAAERELCDVLVLQILAERLGETIDGVITGVANFGIFVELSRYLIEGLVQLEDLGDDWWDVEPRYGRIRGQSSGKIYRIGDLLRVKIVDVDLPRRQLRLVPIQAQPARKKPARKRAKRSK